MKTCLFQEIQLEVYFPFPLHLDTESEKPTGTFGEKKQKPKHWKSGSENQWLTEHNWKCFSQTLVSTLGSTAVFILPVDKHWLLKDGSGRRWQSLCAKPAQNKLEIWISCWFQRNTRVVHLFFTLIYINKCISYNSSIMLYLITNLCIFFTILANEMTN